jgi:hypothetical protein
MKTLKQELQNIKSKTTLKEFTIKEATRVLKLYANTGMSNGFLDFDPTKLGSRTKALILSEKLNEKGLKTSLDLDSSYIEVQW